MAENALKGLQMELNDSAYKCIHAIEPSTDPMEGFKSADVACLVGARPRGPGMMRADLLKANANIFKGMQANAAGLYALRRKKKTARLRGRRRGWRMLLRASKVSLDSQSCGS